MTLETPLNSPETSAVIYLHGNRWWLCRMWHHNIRTTTVPYLQFTPRCCGGLAFREELQSRIPSLSFDAPLPSTIMGCVCSIAVFR